MISIHRVVTVMAILLPMVLSAPVKPAVKDVPDIKEGAEEDQGTGLHYDKYLREVVAVLESDPDFKKKLEEANITDIKSGKIATHLELVQHGLRTQLDEIKRKEVDRLRQYHKQQIELNNASNLKVPDHMDHRNLETFEAEDLRKLILKATQDLDELDTKRKEEFKEYEMQKEHDRREKLKGLNEEQKKEEEKKFEEMKKKHADHPKINHPGSKQQLEEVWEEQDGYKDEEFNPKTFFMLHDTNGDGVWDEFELEALFERELEKSFDDKNPEDDPVEKEENRNRMREHVMKEIDASKDGMISMEEFIKSTQGEDFDNKEEWKDVEETQDIFTDDEFAAYEKKLQEDEAKRQEFLDSHAQPGEVNIPPKPDHEQPPVVSDHKDQQPQAQAHVMEQAQGQPQHPPQPQGHQPEQQGQTVEQH